MNPTYVNLTTEEIVYIGNCIELVDEMTILLSKAGKITRLKTVDEDNNKKKKRAMEFLNSLIPVNEVGFKN